MSNEKFNNINTITGTKALEMIMRDVLDGMEEFSNAEAYNPGQGEFEILGIEKPAASKPVTAKKKAKRSANNQSADIVSFIEIREKIALKLSA